MQHSNINTIKFITILTITVSSLLSITSTQLKILQMENEELDKQKNILKAIGLDLSKSSIDNIKYEYDNRIRNVILDLNGNMLDSIKFENLELLENKQSGEIRYFIGSSEYLPAYNSINPPAFIIPISGKGLWSTLYGYLALKDDYNTVLGITFYKHKETAGLGGEIDKKWFQNNFINKEIYNLSGELVSINVIKGKASEVLDGKSLKHGVDGISGATVTSKGVTTLLKRDLHRYKPFFDKKINE